MRCNIDGCEKEAKYLIEWWGLNQYGENPIVEDEAYVCENSFHVVRASHHYSYGGVPDAIYETEEYTKQPELLEDIVKTFKDLGLV